MSEFVHALAIIGLMFLPIVQDNEARFGRPVSDKRSENDD
jgi:hypothetical protein